MNKDASNLARLPAPATAPELLKVSFRKRGAIPKSQANVIPAPETTVPAPKLKPTLQAVVMRNEQGQPISTGLYEFPGQYGFYIRPYYRGRQRKKKLDVPLITNRDRAVQKAIAVYEEFTEDLRLFKRGKIPRDPFRDSEEKDFFQLCEFYGARGYPGRKQKKPVGKELKEELRRVKMLMAWPLARRGWDEIRPADRENYFSWRTKKLKRLGKGGARTVDLELVTASKIFKCAIWHESKTGVTKNPFEHRERFVDSATIEHCRDFMPRSADDLHALANHLLSDPRSEALGWLALFQAMTGHRINEILRLRTDAKETRPGEGEPGLIDYPPDYKRRKEDDPLTKKILHLYRKDGHKSTFGYVAIFPELAKVIEAHRLWLKKRYPAGTPWYFPSPKDPSRPVDVSSLTHALQRAALVIGQIEEGKGGRTSHGLRAFRVNVLRSEGKPDDLIALLVGQKTHGRMIRDVYGEGLSYKIGYTPENVPPAWDKWLPKTKRTGPSVVQEELL